MPTSRTGTLPAMLLALPPQQAAPEEAFMEVTRGRCGRAARRRGVRDGAARHVTAAGRRRQQLRWRSARVLLELLADGLGLP